MAEFPADATVDTAAPAEPMQLAQIEEKKPAEFKGFLSMGWMPKAVCLSLQNFGNNWALPLPFALLRMFLPWCCIRTRSGKKSPSESMHLSLMRKCARCKGAL